MKGYGPLKAHPFFDGIDFENLPKSEAPELMPYLPAKGENAENLWGKHKVCYRLQWSRIKKKKNI